MESIPTMIQSPRKGFEEYARLLLLSAHVEDGGCWIWQYKRDANGYGRQHYGRRERVLSSLAHRALYACFFVLDPDLPHLDHLCRNRACINPAHLEQTTARTNTMRSLAISAMHARRTHCGFGHPFDEVNTYIRPDGARMCRVCNARRQRETKARRLARLAALSEGREIIAS